MNKSSLHSLLTVVALLAVIGLGYLVYARSGESGGGPQAGAGKSGLLVTESEFRDKLTELRMQRDKVQRGIKRLEGLKAKTVQHLRDKGINSGEDYKNSTDPDVKYAVANLKEWAAQISKIEKEVAYYDEAISGIRVMLDKIERERINESVSLSEDEYLELQKIIVDLNERLKIETDILEEDELGKLLDLEMTRENDK